jgi:hypothetical protein
MESSARQTSLRPKSSILPIKFCVSNEDSTIVVRITQTEDARRQHGLQVQNSSGISMQTAI